MAGIDEFVCGDISVKLCSFIFRSYDHKKLYTYTYSVSNHDAWENQRQPKHPPVDDVQEAYISRYRRHGLNLDLEKLSERHMNYGTPNAFDNEYALSHASAVAQGNVLRDI
jgi:hypothetical protein